MLRGQSAALTGFAIVVIAASLFGTLGPLSRFAYDAGMEPLAFVGWRAFIGLIATAAVVAWRVRRGDEVLVRWAALPSRERLLLGIAALTGFTLNFAMFIAFDLVTIALATTNVASSSQGTSRGSTPTRRSNTNTGTPSRRNSCPISPSPCRLATSMGKRCRSSAFR